MTYCFIIVLTIYLTSRTDLMHENLTGVMAIEKYHNISILFIIFCACFFAYKTHAIYKKTFVHNRIYNIVIILTAVIMIVGALSPYTLNSRDFSLYFMFIVQCFLVYRFYVSYGFIQESFYYLTLHFINHYTGFMICHYNF